jgi:hypothetical protein
MLPQLLSPTTLLCKPTTALQRSGGMVLLTPEAHALLLQQALHTAFQTPGSSVYQTARSTLKQFSQERGLDPSKLSPKLSNLLTETSLDVKVKHLNATQGDPKSYPLQLLTLEHDEAKGGLSKASRYLYKKVFQHVEADVAKYLRQNSVLAFADRHIRGKESLLQHLHTPSGFLQHLLAQQQQLGAYPPPEQLTRLGQARILSIPQWNM